MIRLEKNMNGQSYQVCVCGGGPAGVCAAIASARTGAKTILIERNGMLGGIWTAGLLSWILDCSNKNGVLRELMTKLEKEGHGRFARGGNFLAEPEQTKLAIEEMCIEAGVEILLYTPIIGAKVSEDGRVTSVVCLDRTETFEVSADVFVDCTGDGDLAYFAGCSYTYGDGDRAQPMSLIALVDGIDAKEAREFDNAEPYPKGAPNAKSRMLTYMRSLGVNPSYGSPSFWHIADGLWLVMTNQEFGYRPDSTAELTKATLHARRELAAQVNALKQSGGVWRNIRLLATAPTIGVRESRRILGEYVLTDEDLINGARFDDAVCDVTFGIDIHPTAATRTFAEECGKLRAKPYQIPLRSLIAKERKNLLMAGRCISGSFGAHSSYRVSGDAAATGEAAGRYAASLTVSKD